MLMTIAGISCFAILFVDMAGTSTPSDEWRKNTFRDVKTYISTYLKYKRNNKGVRQKFLVVYPVTSPLFTTIILV